MAWQGKLVAKYAASSQDAWGLRPNDLLFWTAIKWGCENGYTVFDWGRTDIANAGLREFKRGWGATEVPLVYSGLPNPPNEVTSGLLMHGMNSVIRKSPTWVCRAAGEVLYRYFG